MISFKKILSIALCLSLSTVVMGQTFKGFYERTDKKAASVSDISGLRAAAIESALNQCIRAGFKICSLMGTRIDYHNKKLRVYGGGESLYSTKVSGVVKSFDHLSLESTSVYTSSDSWSQNSPLCYYMSMAAKNEALDTAIQNCFLDGNDVCSIEEIKYKFMNQYAWDYELHRYRYKTSGQASVKGYKAL